jgi:predicted transposase YbfD/YdcC
MVESQVELDDVVSCERRYFLTSFGCDAARFAQAVRQHWGIENSLHWVLDVSFQEEPAGVRHSLPRA